MGRIWAAEGGERRVNRRETHGDQQEGQPREGIP
jgi:hypothetical protein